MIILDHSTYDYSYAELDDYEDKLKLIKNTVNKANTQHAQKSTFQGEWCTINIFYKKNLVIKVKN